MARDALEMLTGYNATYRVNGEYWSNRTMLKTELAESQPTLYMDKYEGLRPLITNGTDTYRLLDSRMGGTLNEKASGGTQRSTNPEKYYRSSIHDDPEAYDRLITADDVANDMHYVLRFEVQMNATDAIRKLKPARAAFNSYYYEDRDI